MTEEEDVEMRNRGQKRSNHGSSDDEEKEPPGWYSFLPKIDIEIIIVEFFIFKLTPVILSTHCFQTLKFLNQKELCWNTQIREGFSSKLRERPRLVQWRQVTVYNLLSEFYSLTMLFQKKERPIKENTKRDYDTTTSVRCDSVSGIVPSNLLSAEEPDATDLFWEDGIVPVSNLNGDRLSKIEDELTVEFDDLPSSSQRKSFQRASAKDKVED